MKQDQIYSAKLGLKLNKNFIPDSMSRCLSAHLSSKFQSNNVWKNHLFLRYMTIFSNFQLTSSLEAASASNVTGINDLFSLGNFKGICNLGGLNRFACANFKVSQVDCPLLSSFFLEPFLFASGAVVNTGEIQSWKDYMRYSLGFGVSCQMPSFAIEIYYSMMIRKGVNEDKNVMQINIGID